MSFARKVRPSSKTSGDADPDAFSGEEDADPDRDPEKELEQAALRLLARRDHSRAELRRKLAGGEPELIDRILDRLAEEHTQDEGRFVEEYIASRRRRGFGPVRIRSELRERGVAQEEIAPQLDLPDADWLEDLRATALRKFGASLPSDPRERARRARFLEYRGFPSELIRRFLSGRD